MVIQRSIRFVREFATSSQIMYTLRLMYIIDFMEEVESGK